MEVFHCPFGDCNFSYSAVHTQTNLEWESSWKCHVFNVHWPKDTRNWQICQFSRRCPPQSCRNTAWKHLAVHIKKFRVSCPIKTCTASFSRADRVAQHMRDRHGDARQ